MAMAAPVVQILSGERLHLSQGPVDVVLKAWGAREEVERAYRAAATRFPAILPELCAELPALRRPLGEGEPPASPVGRRMDAACRPFAGVFLTPMAAVAGAVADELMAAMRAAAGFERAYVNDGGDIALWCAPGQSLAVGIAGWDDGSADIPGHQAMQRTPAAGAQAPGLPAAVTIGAGDGIGGVATSGARGRSFSLGIADAVTVLARDAASADAAATLIANAVTVDHAGIGRVPAEDLDPDSDLGDRLVTVAVAPLPAALVLEALERGRAVAARFLAQGLIGGAALSLQGRAVLAGGVRPLPRAGARIPSLASGVPA